MILTPIAAGIELVSTFCPKPSLLAGTGKA
jgi:hypothetical protein